MQPGDQRGWHKHDVPLLGYVLDGELTIDLGPLGMRVFKKGEAFLEAVGTAHNGKNLGSREVRVLAVFMGEEGVPNTVMVAAPK
jgi:quercetin dioxygenase-like cupin family protein